MDALAGIRVIDLSHVIAGPTASHYLALQGAEVIKVENPWTGDILRHGVRDRLDTAITVGFAAINGGKKSLAIDLKDARCRDALMALVRTADVFIENFRPGAVARLGFDHAAVAAVKPDIIYASISGFGQEGAWGRRAAYDHVVQSAVGMAMMQGIEGGDPMKVGFPVIDTATGMIGAQAILSALIRRLRKGEGSYLDISMAQAALQLMWPEAARAAVSGGDAPRVGNRGFSGSPGGSTFRCADGWVSTAANTARQFRVLCTVVGVPEVLQDLTLLDLDALARGAGFVVPVDRERLQAILEQAILRIPGAELEARLAAEDVPCARLATLAEFIKRAASEKLLTLPLRRTAYAEGALIDFGAGYRADRSDGAPLAPAPRLGQHTAALLAEAGMSAAQVEALASAGKARL
ncbi:MAG: CoA transferase [Burkholderiales bacterium]|nr:CoA transferase [Burkholderiales bacterium]